MRKPLALHLRDCRLAVDLDSRNALWALSEHMFAVYQLMKSMPVVVPAGAMAAHNADIPPATGFEALIREEVPSTVGPLQESGTLQRSSGGLRRVSLFPQKPEATEADKANGNVEDGGDLLRLVLAQREVTMLSA